MSADDRKRKVGAAAPPLTGPAKTLLAVWVLSVTAKVPEVVTGELATVNCAGIVNPTLVTVPRPDENTVQFTGSTLMVPPAKESHKKVLPMFVGPPETNVVAPTNSTNVLASDALTHVPRPTS